LGWSIGISKKSSSENIIDKIQGKFHPKKRVPGGDSDIQSGSFIPTKDTFSDYKGKSILDPETAQKYCQDIVKKHDYNTFIVGKHFPESRQAYFYTVHAFFLEVLKSREVSRQAYICKRRLLWWDEMLKDIEEGKEPFEPIGVALKALKKNTNVNFDLLHRLTSFQLFDLERMEMKNMNDLTIYAENTRSLTFYAYLHILGIDDSNAYSAASYVGRWYGIIDVLRKMQYYLINGRHYIPSDILLKHNLYFDRIYNPRVEGLVAEEFFDVILEIAAHAKKYLELGRTYKDKLPKHAHRALLFGVEAEIYLKDLEEYNFDIFNEHFRKTSYFKLPLKMLRASKNQSY
jgi:NADH dehydrogenase [ubiquinone] 1 alpha subcomplex assembly factor 6